jgi:hypothetical protein
MIAFLWGAAVWLSLAGALLYWGAGTLQKDGFYGGAAHVLVAALLCAGLAQTWPCWAAWWRL